MKVYYNEIDSFAAQWLRNLIEVGLIANGDVDERSIEDVTPGDLAGYTQCHFFAGIGGWSYALRLAGWPDDKPVWTGSCPCQPFSTAGKGTGFADERHLWPAFHHLIHICKPPVIFGEQVASKDGLTWLDLVQTDLEGSGYTTGAADLCAAGVGAPHIRQRLYWLADSSRPRLPQRECYGRVQSEALVTSAREAPVSSGTADRLANTGLQWVRSEESGTLESSPRGVQGEDWERQWIRANPGTSNTALPYGLAHSGSPGLPEQLRRREQSERSTSTNGTNPKTNPTNGFWRDPGWLFCTDAKWRPVAPGTFPLADGISNRVAAIRGAGNAIVPQVAAQFIRAYTECEE